MGNKKRTETEICYSCVLYDNGCKGERFEWAIGTRENRLQHCVNAVDSPDCDANPIQRAGFNRIYRSLINQGVNSTAAFCEAIIATSDDVFEKAMKKHPHLIEQHRQSARRRF